MTVSKPLRHGVFSWRQSFSAKVVFMGFVCLVLTGWLVWNTRVSASEVPKQKRILFLFPHETGLPLYEVLYQTIRTTIQKDLTEPLDIYAEYLDRARFSSDSYQTKLFDLFGEKYTGKHIDLWIGIGYSTAELAERYGNNIFTDTPSIILDYANPLTGAPTFENRPHTTGVVAELDMKKNLEIALSLHPDTRKIYIVSGTSPSDRFLEKISRIALQEFESKVEVVYLSGLPIEELVAQMESLPPRSVVMYLQIQRDGNGEVFYSKDIVRIIAQKSNAPVYSMWSQQLGEGVVGGHVINVERAGVKAGELAVRILRGERPESIPIVRDGLFSDMFDWRQLKRHGIVESKLPEGSLVLYKELNLFEKYRWVVIGVVVFILVQTIFLVFLVDLNRKQKRTRDQLAEAESRYRELLHCDRVSRLGQLTASLAHEINQPLTAILSSAQAGLRFLDADEKDPALMRRIMENIVRDDKRAAGVLTSLRSLVKREEKVEEQVVMNAIVEDVASILQSEATLRNVKIERDLDESLPFIIGDPTQLRQVILNLIMNAFDVLSFNPPHRRKVILQTKMVNHSVQVAVKDLGPGIQAERPEQLFQPFYTTKGSGMGMGLAVSSAIVKKHGGRIWAENSPGGGAIFCFTLPVPQNESQGNVHFYY